MTEPIWTDETQENYCKWHLAHYGVEPPEVKMKEVKMQDKKFISPVTTVSESIFATGPGQIYRENLHGKNIGKSLQPSPVKRTRRHKGLPDNVMVETIKNAYIDLFIPKRPEGMNRVFIRVWKPGELADVGIEIEWPEGKTAIEAIETHFKGESN